MGTLGICYGAGGPPLTDPARCPAGGLLYGKELGAGMRPQPQSAEWQGARPESGPWGRGIGKFMQAQLCVSSTSASVLMGQNVTPGGVMWRTSLPWAGQGLAQETAVLRIQPSVLVIGLELHTPGHTLLAAAQRQPTWVTRVHDKPGPGPGIPFCPHSCASCLFLGAPCPLPAAPRGTVTPQGLRAGMLMSRVAGDSAVCQAPCQAFLP